MSVSSNQPLRVAMVMGKMLGGGVEAVVMNNYRYIDRHKVQFDFLVDADSTLVPREEIEARGGRIFDIPPYQHVGEYQKVLQRLFRQEGWRIVHSHINALSVFPLGAAKKAGVPVRIAHSHSTSSKGEFVRNAAKQLLRTQANRYPTVRLACTEHAGKWLFGDAPFEVLANPIDFKRFTFDPEARVELRRAWGVGDADLLVGHVGRWAPQKNQIHLLHVLKGLVESGVSAKLALLGDGPDRVAIEAEAESLGLTDRLIAPGCVDSAKAYSAFDLFCFPSRYEGLGMAAMEAQASGLPCFVSDAVPNEIDLTGKVRFLPLDSADAWTVAVFDAVRQGAFLGPDRTVDIAAERFRKYDPAKSAVWLQDMYLRLDREARR